MDPIFQSLLLNQSTAGGSAGAGSGGTDGGANGDGGSSGPRRSQPRPSRYAQLIPREALRPQQQPSSTAATEDGKHGSDSIKDGVPNGMNGDENNVSSASIAAAEQNEGEGNNIRVYKMDGTSGNLELLPEEEYDLVYYSDVVGDGQNESEGEDEKKGEVNDEGDETDAKMDEDMQQEKVDDAANDEDAMDIDKKDEEPNETSDVNDDEQGAIYIVKTPASTSNHNNQQTQDGDDTSSSSDTDSSLDNNNNISKSIPLPSNPRAVEASSTASTLARALASRTDNFDKLRPNYGLMLESNAEKLKGMQNKKEGQKKKLPTSTPASSSAAVGSKGRDDKDKSSSDAPSDAHSTLQQYQASHRLISSLPKSANIRDGDSPQTLLQLSKMRRWQENHIEPKMQGVELDDWEDGIDWEGGCDGDDEEKKVDERNKSSAIDAMDVDKVDKEKGKQGKGEDEVDCTPDFVPPVPFGGHPKRPRRTLPQYDDPMELLLEPRNPRLEALDLSATVDWEGGTSDSDAESVYVPLILQSSIAGQSVATLLAPNPTSRPLPFESHPNYQARYEREVANEISSTADLAKPNSGIGPNEAMEKYKKMRQLKREQMAKDKQSRVTEVMSALSLTGTGRRITSSLMGPGGAERTGRPSRHALGGSSVHDAEYVEQLELVYNHTLAKPDLTMSEYRQFHRPRLPLVVVSPSCPWQFQTRVIVENKRGRKKAATASADGSTIVGSYHAMMSAGAKGQSKIRNEADLSPTIGDLVVMEYSEEHPPLSMTKGMTCRIVNYYRGDRSRCPISAGGGDRPLRKRHGDKAASAAKGPTGPSNRAERPPRLRGPNQYVMKSPNDLIGIVPSSKKKKSKEAAALEAKKAKENAIDVLPEGVTEILHQKVHGPFIGEVEEGVTQTGLISNLFCASMFRHDSEPTDFLMILGQMKEKQKPLSSSATESGGLGVVLRPLPPNIYCVGQTEPRVKVFAPNTNDEKKFINAFVPYQVAKNIQRAEERGDGLTFDDIRDRLFSNTFIPPGQLRIRIKQVANFERGNNGIWSLKAMGQDDFPGVDALGRKVSPEGVAAYESQCAGIRRLKDLGIKDLFSGHSAVANVASVMIYLNGAAHSCMERRLKLKKVLELKRRQKSPQLAYYEKAFEKLDAQYKEAKKQQEVAKFIYEELQLSPWNISGEFIDVHKRAVSGSMMKLTGIGDPSGVGEAYNFLREADTRSNKGKAGTNNDGALNAQIKKITGTENDLRKLTMKQMASLLRSYGMKDKQISVLKRWDRVHVIRDLSTKAASDGMGDEMERFARGEKLRLSDQRQNYKERLQEIWRRQIAALSTADAVTELASRSDMEVDAAKDSKEADGGSDTGKEKNKDGNDSDSSEDDDFFAEMEMEMTNTGEANRLVSGLGAGDGDTPMRGTLNSQELSRDAREFAALQRQREEERAMQEGLNQKSSTLGMGQPKKKFKVIRRKITKTRPDGTQSVTFEFIVNREKVDEMIAKKKEKEGEEKKQNEKKRRRRKVAVEDTSADEPSSGCVGHAMFEDDDNNKRRSTKIKIKKDTRLVQRKAPGPKKGSHSKLTSSIKHSRARQQEERKKKRERIAEEADLYKRPVKGKGANNRRARERQPHVILSDRLESIRSAVEARPNVGAFLKPVPRELYPHYYEIIHEPIDLSAIKEKNSKYGYPTADEFVKDFDLMKTNAVRFNGKGSPLAVEAVEVAEFVKTTVEQNRKELTEMEEAVRDQKDGKKKKKKGKAAETAKAPVNTASVVLDGIETQVNLGANLSFGFGDSDSDDS